MSHDPFNWNQALNEVESAGGNLLAINTQAENEFVRSQLGNSMVMIGYSDDGVEGTGTWSNGDPVTIDLSYANTDEDDYAVMNFWAGTWQMVNEFVAKKHVMEMGCAAGMQAIPMQFVPGTQVTELFPNPAKDLITIRILSENEENAEMTIFNMQGQAQVVSSTVLAKGINEFDIRISDIETGVYFLRISGKNLNQMVRFVKMD